MLAVLPVLPGSCWHQIVFAFDDTQANNVLHMQGSIPTDKPILELTCNGQAIPDNLTLAAIKTFVWKRSDDLVFVYRIRNAMYPAPIAQIGPAS